MALFLSLVAVFVLVCGAAGGVSRIAIAVVRRPIPNSLAAPLLIGPVLLAGAVCAALVWPGLIGAGCHCIRHGLHHPHLCLSHPDLAAAAWRPALCLLVVWAALTLPRLGRGLLGLAQTALWSRSLSACATDVCDGVRFRWVDAPSLGACTTGLFRPFIAVDRQLWSELAADERRAVLHHERAHCKRHDPLTLFVLETCAALCLVPAASRLLALWRQRSELECDRHAAVSIGSPDAVASALLKLVHQRPEPRSLGAGGGNLADRIRALLAPDFCGSRVELGNDAAAVARSGTALALVLALLGNDAVHHATETLLGLLVGGH